MLKCVNDENTPFVERASQMTDEKKVIAMISIGDRPWSKKASETFKYYCERIGADFQVISNYPTKEEFPLPEMPDTPGRKHKLAYACKAYFAWDLLENGGYSRVVIVDDTCCVSPLAPDIFAAVPAGSCGFTGTSALHAEMSFDTIRAYVRARNLEDVPYLPGKYMNSGVMVYDKASKESLHKDRIIEAADLLYARYPNQTLTYYLLQRGAVPMARISKAFNSLPASGLPKSERKELTDVGQYLHDNIFIYHITGSFGNRQLIVEQIAEYMLTWWEDKDGANNSSARRRPPFDIARYWEERYQAGRGAGPSSTKAIVQSKANFINQLYPRFNLQSHIDFGCDDGRLLKRLNVPKFIGIDLSDTLLNSLRTKFSEEEGYEFFNLRLLDKAHPCDLATSLDVIQYLVTEEAFSSYMKRLFRFARKIVCIYASDEELPQKARHVRFRHFSTYVKENFPEWQLKEVAPSAAQVSHEKKSEAPLFSFYVYERMVQN